MSNNFDGVTVDREEFLDGDGGVDDYRIRMMDRSLDWELCAQIRVALRSGEADSAAELARADNRIDASRRTVQKHARGACKCPVDEPELTHTRGDGWSVADEKIGDE